MYTIRLKSIAKCSDGGNAADELGWPLFVLKRGRDVVLTELQNSVSHYTLIFLKELLKCRWMYILTKAVILLCDIMFRQRSSFIAIKNACLKLKMQHCFQEKGTRIHKSLGI